MFAKLVRSPLDGALDPGPLMAVAAGIESVQPSLMPRTKIDQALATAGSVASAYVVGRATAGSIDGISRITGINPFAAASGIAAVGFAVGRWNAPMPDEPMSRAWVRTAATLVGTAAFAKSAGAAARRTIDDAPGRWRTAASLAGVGILGGLGAMAARERIDRYKTQGSPPLDPTAATQGLGIGLAIAGTVIGLASLERRGAHAIARAGSRAVGGPPWAWRGATYGALLAGAGTAGYVGANKLMGKVDAGGSRVEPGYADAPTTRNASGGPGSVVSYADLGLQGRRFVSELSSRERIREVMGVDNVDEPIRVYVGVDSAPTIEDRIALAIAELRRTGAFDRSLLMVGSPAGTGYFNYIPVEAAEYMTLGDMASVAVQFGKRPSMLSMDKVGIAADQHAQLVAAIHRELEALPAGSRPRVVLYGESLGAQASQEGFVDEGTRGLTDLGIDRALWVGTPYATRWKRQVLGVDRADVDASLLGHFHTSGQLASTSTEDLASVRFFFLDHHEDPVTRFGTDLAAQQPAWLGDPADRLPGVPVGQRWVPIVTYWQTAIDTKNAATVVPGEFKAHGHDYRADLAGFVRVAYGIEGVTDTQMARIEARLRRSEVERAEQIARD
jgi:uncharacterized membrane protein